MNIRIGNDIQVNVALDETKMANKTIQKAVCHLISAKHAHCASSPKSYIPTEYTIHGCGVPSYNVQPVEHPHFHGSSVCKDKVVFGKDEPTFSTKASVVSNTKLTFYFPACHQKHIGPHKLIVELVVTDSKNLSTYAFDFGSIFSLTDKAYGQQGDIVIEAPNLNGSIVSVSPVNKIVCIAQNSSISIGGKDVYDKEYGLITTLFNNSAVKYTPVDWNYSVIKFISADPSVATVDANGTIAARATKSSRDVVITAYDEDNLDVRTEIILHVNGSESDTTTELYSTQVYDPYINLNQSVINSQLNASIIAMENSVGKTIDDMFVVVMSQGKYDRLVQLNQIKNNTFYYTYEDEEDEPTTDSRVEGHTLYTSGTVSNGILTVSGTVTNHTLTL